MFALTIKGLRAHKLRYLMTGLAVVLGVAFMTGTMVLTDTMEKTFNGVISTANAGTDVIVRRAASLDGEFTAARERIDATVVDQVAAVDGVDAAHGSVQGFAQLVRADGSASANEGLGATMGSNWIGDERLNPLSLSTGDVPSGDDEAVIDQRTVDEQGWTVGDTITVLTKSGRHDLELVGTATYGDVEGVPGSTIVATTDATAQRLFGEVGRYDAVLVAAADGVLASELKSRLDLSVTAPSTGLESATGDADTADKQADLKEDLSFFNTFLLAFAYVALFVGTFIIYNTFSILVAQRTKELAMLRAVGAARTQVLRSIVLESIVVGVAASAAGLVGGVGLSFGLRALIGSAGLEIPGGSLVVSPNTVITAFLVGTVVSVVSAIAPALRAGKVRPIAALRDVAVDRSGVSTARAVAGAGLGLAGTAAFVGGVTGSGDSALRLLGLGVVTVIVAMCTIGPVLVRPVLRVFGSPAAATGITGSYARRNAQRNPRRTSATASALMIGVALVGFITILANSTTESVERAVDRSFRADYVVDSGSFTEGFSPAIEDDVAGAARVEHVSGLRTAPVEIDGAVTDLAAMDTLLLEELYDLDVTAGSLADIGSDGIAMTTDDAADKGLQIGDRVTLRFAGGVDVPVAVRALYEEKLPGSANSSWLVDLTTFEKHVTDQYDRKLFVTFADDVSPEASRAELERVLADWPNAEIQDQAEFKASVTGEIKQILNLIYGLLALAVVIALIGIANTLALSIHERTPELGLLRAVGMQRRQVRSSVRWEALMITLVGVTTGAVLAVGGAYGIVSALDSEGVTRLSIPTGQLLTILALAAAAGVFAATGPARRAARLNVLGAIAAE